jgi:ATP adenylyltransferase
MKQIWAPWRIEYIKHNQNLTCHKERKTRNKKERCFLCDFKKKTDEDILILYRGKHSFIIMNRYPYNPGHLMIAPYRHIGLIEKCNNKETGEMFTFIQKSITALKKSMQPEGFNIGCNLGLVAGAGVPGHIHIHIIPRWLGDTNFMPIVGKTKVINEELYSMYHRLKKVLERGR